MTPEDLSKEEARRRKQQRETFIILFGLAFMLGFSCTVLSIFIVLGESETTTLFDILGLFAFSGGLLLVGGSGLYSQRNADYTVSIYAGTKGRILSIFVIIVGATLVLIPIIFPHFAEKSSPTQRFIGIVPIWYGIRELRKNLTGYFDTNVDPTES